MKVYVPLGNEIEKVKCISVNRGFIRLYKEQPRPLTYNQTKTIDYIDVYLDSYLVDRGQERFSSYSTIPYCAPYELTNEYWYRLDIANIIILFMFLAYFIVFIPIRLFRRPLKKWLNY